MKRLSFIFAILLALAACGPEEEQGAFAKAELDRFAVKTEVAQLRDISEDLLLTGSVKAWEEAVIYPRVDGKLLRNVLKEGDSVKRGQNIALIERDEVGAVYEPVLVPSTLTGVIGLTYLDPGANVTKNTAVALVVNQQSVRILVEIPERYIGKIHLGQKAVFNVEAYGKKDFEATIYKMSPVVDSSSRVVQAELRADNKDGLIKSGMFAKVNLRLDESKNVLSVSLGAVERDAATDTYYVYKVNGDTVAKTEVKPGLRSNDYQEISSGLAESETVAKIVFGLKDGSKIQPQQAASLAQEAQPEEQTQEPQGN